jgi:hypothetical protein
MQKHPRLHAISRSLFSRTHLLRSPLFASGSTGHSTPMAPARAFDPPIDQQRKSSVQCWIIQLSYWVAGCIAFIGALMTLSHIAFLDSIR